MKSFAVMKFWEILHQQQLYLLLKIEKSRRVAESLPVCVDLKTGNELRSANQDGAQWRIMTSSANEEFLEFSIHGKSFHHVKWNSWNFSFLEQLFCCFWKFCTVFLFLYSRERRDIRYDVATRRTTQSHARRYNHFGSKVGRKEIVFQTKTHSFYERRKQWMNTLIYSSVI